MNRQKTVFIARRARNQNFQKLCFFHRSLAVLRISYRFWRVRMMRHIVTHSVAEVEKIGKNAAYTQRNMRCGINRRTK